MARPKVDKSKIDVAGLFLTYMSLIGDVQRVAAATDMDPAFVQAIAEDEGWDKKISQVSLMSKGERPGDWERAKNRAINYVLIHRTRMLIENLVRYYGDYDVDGLAKATALTDEKGRLHASAKFLADLSTALERCTQMSYAALGDTLKEREARTDQDGNSLSVADLHVSLINALNNTSGALPPKQLLTEVECPLPANHEQVTHVTQVSERNSPDPAAPDAP